MYVPTHNNVHNLSCCPVYDPSEHMWRMCSIAFQPATHDNRTQVRSYCRGVVCRAVDPETRTKLFARLHVTEMASMRSFLDPPPKKGLTIKGSGDVGYALHKRNHTNQVVVQGSELHRQVSTRINTTSPSSVTRWCIMYTFLYRM
jgi:hypothetical protein